MTDLPDFIPDCAECAALCCMALAFDAGEDFALDKPAGLPCPKLTQNHSCSIYADLHSEGFSGCTRYSCLGAGQRVTQEVFKGESWQSTPALAAPMAEALRLLHEVHKAIELLATAAALPLEDEDEAQRLSLLATLTPQGGFTRETLTSPELAQAIKATPRFLQTLRDYI